MGLNVDLCQILGVPNTLRCPKCNNDVEQYFDDYDIECGNPNPAPGKWQLHAYCNKCGHEWDVHFILKATLR